MAAVVFSFLGMSWFALAMPAHWQQVFAAPREPTERSSPSAVLRVLAVLAVLASGVCCIQADHASIAVLVWLMLNTGAGIAVAMMLARRPGLLRALLPVKSRMRGAQGMFD